MSTSPRIRASMQESALEVGGLIHRIRVTILLLVALRLLLFAWPGLLVGEAKHWFTMSVMLGGIGLSFGVWRGLRQAPEKQPWLMASVLLDVILALGILLPSIVSPVDGYYGLLRGPDILILPIISIAAGLRLTRQVALTGGMAMLVAMLTMIALDLRLNEVTYGTPQILLATVLMVSAVVVTYGLVLFINRLLHRALTEAQKSADIRQKFGAYVAEEFAQIVLGPDGLSPQRAEVAILFSDLRGFTRYSETTTPTALITELNAYFEAVVGAVREEGGVVDKYIGDAVMVVFGLPSAKGDEAGSAIRAAMKMRQALAIHNQARAARGLPALAQGIGVHLGDVVAGPVGTEERTQYTVLGDTVNVAARLEAATKNSGSDVLFSGDVVDRARQEGAVLPPLEAIDDLALRGRVETVAVYRLTTPSG